MRTVAFLGLCHDEVAGLTDQDIRQGGVDEIWTVNNYYDRDLSVVNPDRVYQCHMQQISTRMVDAYNASGALIVTPQPVAGLHRNRVFDASRLFDIEHHGFFSSSFAPMWLDAWSEHVDMIVLLGIPLAAGIEYQTQVPGMLAGIKQSRAYGINVWTPHEKRWLAHMDAPDWNTMYTLHESYIHYCTRLSNGTEG